MIIAPKAYQGFKSLKLDDGDPGQSSNLKL